MNLIAQIVEDQMGREMQRCKSASRSLADDNDRIMSELSRIIEPVRQEIATSFVEETRGDTYYRTMAWRVTCTSSPLKPFFLVYRHEDGWRLEARSGEEDILEAAYVATFPDCVPNWTSDVVRNFLCRQIKRNETTSDVVRNPLCRQIKRNETTADDAAVWVVAEWNRPPVNGSDESGGCVLIKFPSGDLVNDLHSLVARLHLRLTDVKTPDLRVYGASVECDSPQVEAWQVHFVSPAASWMAQSLGDGLLLDQAVADRVRTDGGVLDMAVLEVRDDGMMLVKCDDGWATIDLTELARVVHNR